LVFNVVTNPAGTVDTNGTRVITGTPLKTAVKLDIATNADSVILKPEGTFAPTELTKTNEFKRNADGNGFYNGYISTIPEKPHNYTITATKDQQKSAVSLTLRPAAVVPTPTPTPAPTTFPMRLKASMATNLQGCVAETANFAYPAGFTDDIGYMHNPGASFDLPSVKFPAGIYKFTLWVGNNPNPQSDGWVGSEYSVRIGGTQVSFTNASLRSVNSSNWDKFVPITGYWETTQEQTGVITIIALTKGGNCAGLQIDKIK
jgi:hypothetical protein